MSKTCPFCNATLNDGDVFYMSCGKRYEAPADLNQVQAASSPAQVSPSAAPVSAKTCNCCGATIKSDDAFCTYCGKPQAAAPAPAQSMPQNSPWNTPLPEGTSVIVNNTKPKNDMGAKVICLLLQLALCATPFLPFFEVGTSIKKVSFSSFDVIMDTSKAYLEYAKYFRKSFSGYDIGVIVFLITSAVFIGIALIAGLLAIFNVGSNSKKFWKMIEESSSAIVLESMSIFGVIYLLDRAMYQGMKALSGLATDLYSAKVWFLLAFVAELVIYFVTRHFVKKYKFVK